MSFNRISCNAPAKIGEILYFKDPDPSANNRWVRIASVPNIHKDEDFQNYTNEEREEIYLDQIVVLEGGTEVYAGELYRGN